MLRPLRLRLAAGLTGTGFVIMCCRSAPERLHGPVLHPDASAGLLGIGATIAGWMWLVDRATLVSLSAPVRTLGCGCSVGEDEGLLFFEVSACRRSKDGEQGVAKEFPRVGVPVGKDEFCPGEVRARPDVDGRISNLGTTAGEGVREVEVKVFRDFSFCSRLALARCLS